MSWTLREAVEEDGAAVAEIYRPVVESTVASFEDVPPDAIVMAKRIRDTVPTHPWLVLASAGGIAGYAYATRHRERAAYRWSVDTSVYVDAAFRRRGVARALYTTLIPILSAQGFAAAHAAIALPNDASIRLHESLGFQLVGTYRHVGYKLGAWHDVGWWQLRLSPERGAPDAPLRMEVVRRHPRWNEWVEAGLACVGP